MSTQPPLPRLRRACRANYTVRFVSPQGAAWSVVALEDLRTGMSITNDAENVIAHVADELEACGLNINEFKVIYRDTEGIWDELAVQDGRFAGFRPLRETYLAVACRKVCGNATR